MTKHGRRPSTHRHNNYAAHTMVEISIARGKLITAYLGGSDSEATIRKGHPWPTVRGLADSVLAPAKGILFVINRDPQAMNVKNMSSFRNMFSLLTLCMYFQYFTFAVRPTTGWCKFLNIESLVLIKQTKYLPYLSRMFFFFLFFV